jgi:trk system potassium uptake protein TrkH
MKRTRVLITFLESLKPFQLLSLGFFSYVVVGLVLLALPISQKVPIPLVDNLFTVVSAMSTTGLTTISVVDSYGYFGQFVILILMQLGGLGYMTITSFIILSRADRISGMRRGILSTQFALPQGFWMSQFVRHVVVFTLVIEALGVLPLYFQFKQCGVPTPLWSAIFHSVSSFATAGFSLNNNSLEGFRDNVVVNVVVGTLCYLGAIGFIVLQDAFLACTRRGHRVTFTSKTILLMTALVLLVCAPVLMFCEPEIAHLPWPKRICVSLFQVMTASSTAGFNTVPICALSAASLTVIIVSMVIGASPSGTGGGIKTTSFSALLGVLVSTLRGHAEDVTFCRRAIPLYRLMSAVASVMLYLIVLWTGVFLLSWTERQDYLKIMFEAASALGTVGLSMGITGALTCAGKLIITALMFLGRVGPLTLGMAVFYSTSSRGCVRKSEDLVT